MFTPCITFRNPAAKSLHQDYRQYTVLTFKGTALLLNLENDLKTKHHVCRGKKPF